MVKANLEEKKEEGELRRVSNLRPIFLKKPYLKKEERGNEP